MGSKVRTGSASSYCTFKPTIPYGSSKAAGFLMLQAFAIANQMEFFYGLYFKSYGEGHLLEIYGYHYGKQHCRELTFQWRWRAIAWFYRGANCSKAFSHCHLQERHYCRQSLAVNIGSGQGISVLEFAKVAGLSKAVQELWSLVSFQIGRINWHAWSPIRVVCITWKT